MSCEGGCEHTGGASVRLSTWLPQNHPPDSVRSKIWTDISVGDHQQEGSENHHGVPNTSSLTGDPLEGQNETSYHLNYGWVLAQTAAQQPTMLFFPVVFFGGISVFSSFDWLMSSDRVDSSPTISRTSLISNCGSVVKRCYKWGGKKAS